MGSRVDQKAGLVYSLKASQGVKFSQALQGRVRACVTSYCTCDKIELMSVETTPSVIVVTVNALTLPQPAADVLAALSKIAELSIEDKNSDILQSIVDRYGITDGEKISRIRQAWDAFMRTVDSVATSAEAPSISAEASSSSMDAIERRRKHRDDAVKGRLPGQTQSMPQLIPAPDDPRGKRVVVARRANADPQATAGTHDAGNIFNHGHARGLRGGGQ